MIELERTYLTKRLSDGLGDSPKKEMLDIYLPADSRHPVLRIRRNGDKMEMTKKTIVEGTDSSKMEEQTIRLSPDEYAALVTVDGKRGLTCGRKSKT